ncbi:MAG: RNA-binding protein hfq [Leptolyngbya sp. SIO1D8]|nr:RNA-binding protein hfq [Leptolyngbya sp. SIO1D8]
MSLEFETGLPSIKLLQTYQRDKRKVEVKLVTGDAVVGTISWQDPLCLCIDAEGEPVLIWRSALTFIKAV